MKENHLMDKTKNKIYGNFGSVLMFGTSAKDRLLLFHLFSINRVPVFIL